MLSAQMLLIYWNKLHLTLLMNSHMLPALKLCDVKTSGTIKRLRLEIKYTSDVITAQHLLTVC